MKRDQKSVVLLLLFLLIFLFSHASSEFLFSDDRFRDKLTTENLDAIIDEYELYDGWYWTTLPDVSQTFHGHPESPGWTSSVENAKRKDYLKGWYGCRWPIDHVRRPLAAGQMTEEIGDIIRVEYKKNGHQVQHSAVVYAVNGEEILFLQVSGGNYNRSSVGLGFTDGNVMDARSVEEISSIPGLKISRYIKQE